MKELAIHYEKPSILGSYAFAWRTFAKHWKPFALAAGALVAVGLVVTFGIGLLPHAFAPILLVPGLNTPQIWYNDLGATPSAPYIIAVVLAFGFIQLVCMVAFAKGTYQVIDGQKATVSSIFRAFPWLKVLGVTFLQSTVIVLSSALSTWWLSAVPHLLERHLPFLPSRMFDPLGYLAYVVPLFFMFAAVAIADSLHSAASALDESASLVFKHPVGCAGFFALSATLIGGGLLLGILPGLLVALPVIGIATTHYYRCLLNKVHPPLN